MSAAKRHVSSLLSASSNPSSHPHNVNEGSLNRSVKRPRIQELSPDVVPERHELDQGAGTTGRSAEGEVDDQSSVLSTSSSEPSSLSSSSDDGAEPHGGSQPADAHASRARDFGSLRARLDMFLPQIQKANETLDPSDASAFEIVDGNSREHSQTAGGATEEQPLGGEDDEEDKEGPYIEMDLGLGVLEEQQASDDSSLDENNSDRSEDGNNETHVLDRLMGRRPVGDEDRQDTGIQEL